MNIKSIDYPGYGKFSIYSSNKTLEFRANSFLTKEPTTLEWIKSLEENSILIDVGANIGIYAIPSALFHVKKVVALEPEIHNYSMLLNNLQLNQIESDKVEALPLAVSTEFANSSTKIYLTVDRPGESCHQVGKSQNYLLQKIEPNKRKTRSVYCVSLASIVQNITTYHDGPIHIKIDVDGIEEDVCQSLFDEKSIHRISSLQIELNPSLDSHQSLIQRLASVGYFYSEEQVKKSQRTSGNFKGFAEIVFKKAIPYDCLHNLPGNYVSFLGSNYKPVDFPSIQNTSTDYLSIDKSKPILISRQPSIYALKNAFDSNKCSSIFHKISCDMLDGVNKDFNFNSNSTSSTRKLRKQISHNLISKVCQVYFEELKENVSSSKIKSIIKSILMDAARYHFSENYLEKYFAQSTNLSYSQSHLFCRIRHFLDLFGYTLDRHHDSPDTLCAMIAPLIPYSTTTSIVNGGILSRKYKRNPSSDLLIDSDFRKAKFNVDLNTATYTSYSFDRSSNAYRQNASLHVQQPELRPGEMIVIPNLQSFVFGELHKNQVLSGIRHGISRNTGHGVLAPVIEPYRPVLLIDYMFAKIQDIPTTTHTDLIIDLGSSNSLFGST